MDGGYCRQHRFFWLLWGRYGGYSNGKNSPLQDRDNESGFKKVYKNEGGGKIMGCYICNNCEKNYDSHWVICFEDPSNPLELLCEECFSLIEEEKEEKEKRKREKKLKRINPKISVCNLEDIFNPQKEEGEHGMPKYR